jgi:hypothetical protein
LYVTKATRKAITAGKGCGKIGSIESPKIMLTRVTAKVAILRKEGSSCGSLAFLSFGFCFRFFSQLGACMIPIFLADVKYLPKTLFCETKLKACCEQSYELR